MRAMQLLCAVALAAFVGCQEKTYHIPPHHAAPVATKPAPAATTKTTSVPPKVTPVAPPSAAGWTVAYTANFKDAAAANDFAKSDAVIKIENGSLTFKPETERTSQIMLKKSFPGSVRVEFTGSLVGEKVSDLSPILNGGDDYASGYLIQVGGKANTLSRVVKESSPVDATEGKLALTPGKTYTVVAENDNGKITLWVDGKQIFTYTDSSPLKGSGHDKIGFYTYNDTFKLDSLKVSTK